jgi:hypothetical protein
MKLALILAFFLALSKSQNADCMNLNQEILTLKNSNAELFTVVKALIEKDNLLENQI